MSLMAPENKKRSHNFFSTEQEVGVFVQQNEPGGTQKSTPRNIFLKEMLQSPYCYRNIFYPKYFHLKRFLNPKNIQVV